MKSWIRPCYQSEVFHWTSLRLHEVDENKKFNVSAYHYLWPWTRTTAVESEAGYCVNHNGKFFIQAATICPRFWPINVKLGSRGVLFITWSICGCDCGCDCGYDCGCGWWWMLCTVSEWLTEYLLDEYSNRNRLFISISFFLLVIFFISIFLETKVKMYIYWSWCLVDVIVY